ncbi:hypothetical protein D3C79_968210 [compost metagenome]
MGCSPCRVLMNRGSSNQSRSLASALLTVEEVTHSFFAAPATLRSCIRCLKTTSRFRSSSLRRRMTLFPLHLDSTARAAGHGNSLLVAR